MANQLENLVKPITGLRWDGALMILKDLDGQAVCRGRIVDLHNGGQATVTGGEAPQSEASSGRVYVKFLEPGGSDRVFYPGVCKLRWEEALP